MCKFLVTAMLEYSAVFSMMSTPHAKVANAVSFFDHEGYDDAFIEAVDKVEERHFSPMNSPMAFSPPKREGYTHRDDVTPKKLDFNAAADNYSSSAADRELATKVKTWYHKMLSLSNVPLPSIETLQAHGELSQEKALFVLCYFPKGGWEKAVDAATLRRFKTMELREIEGWMQQKSCGSKFLKTNWSKQDNNHIVFQGEINSEGFWSIKGPYFEQAISPLQRVFGNGGVLRFHFEDYKKNSEVVEGTYRKIAREGIWIGLRHYKFFAFKDPKGKKKQGAHADISSVPKCFFVCTESLAKWDKDNPKFCQYGTVREAQQYLMHIDTVSSITKKFARLQLALSQSLPILDLNLPDINVEVIDDIYCRDQYGEVVCDANGERLIHTDGTGFISKDLAAFCPASICKGSAKSNCIGKPQELPLLLQVRVFYNGMVAKGTLLVHSKLPPSTIQLRKSMVKVQADKTLKGPCYNSLEVCATSRRPSKAKLSPYLALLLTYGGVSEATLMKFVHNELDEITGKLKIRTAALTALTNGSSDQVDHFDSAVRMLVANLPLDEPYLKKTLMDFTRSQLQELKTGRVTIPDTYNLYGCADPTGRLERDQVVIILEQGPLCCPKVLVYKSPGLHVGDVKQFEAIWHKDFEEIVGNGKYVIFFSVKGPRSIVDEIANSDLDGDQYWCCANGLIVNDFKASSAWQNPCLIKKTVSKMASGSDDLDKTHFEAYLKARFKPSLTMGVAANSWQAHMDKYLLLDEHHPGRKELWCTIQSLVDTYYEAVDAEKTGRQVTVRDEHRARELPHYKEKLQESGAQWIKKEKSTYHSTTLLGKIYDLVKGMCETKDYFADLEKLISEDKFIDKRFQYDGFEVHHRKWNDKYQEYRTRMAQLMCDKDGDRRTAEIESLFLEYRWDLYKSETLINSPEPIEEIYKQASAIYVVVYGHAQRLLESQTQEEPMQVQGCRLGLQFAWKVAGFALVRLFGRESHEKRKEPLLIEESVFRNLKLARKD